MIDMFVNHCQQYTRAILVWMIFQSVIILDPREDSFITVEITVSS